jgi:hypothetical protein
MLITSNRNLSSSPNAYQTRSRLAPEPAEMTAGDRVDIALVGALPVIGAGMNIVYGGSMSLLAQKPKLGVLSLVGGAANLASLPLLASGNYLAALGALSVSAATLSHVHRNW